MVRRLGALDSLWLVSTSALLSIQHSKLRSSSSKLLILGWMMMMMMIMMMMLMMILLMLMMMMMQVLLLQTSDPGLDPVLPQSSLLLSAEILLGENEIIAAFSHREQLL